MSILNDQALEVLRKSGEWISEFQDAYLKTGIYNIDGFRSQIDLFSRIRTSDPITLISNKNLYSGNEHVWHKKEVGGGAVSFNLNEVSMNLSVGTADGDVAIRQSRPNTYNPGNSQLAGFTGVFGANPTVNNVRRVGSFDDENGYFLEQYGFDINFVIRSSVSGAVVDTRIPQSQWNIDTYPELDLSKVQIVAFLSQCPVGLLVLSIANSNGTFRRCHAVLTSNTSSVPYLNLSTLPARLENRNIGETANGTTLKESCVSVISEGGEIRTGFNFSIHSGLRNITTITPILAIRLKSTFNTRKNRVLVQVISGDLFARDAVVLFKLNRVSEPSSVTGGTWTSVNTASGSEYNLGLTAFSGSHILLLSHSTVAASSTGVVARPGSVPISSGQINEHAFISQNVDSDNSDMFVVTAESVDGTAVDVSVTFNFSEYH